MLMLVIASSCKNMWVSLGIGVILVFTMSIFPQDNLILSLCPFSSPYQTLAMAAESGRVPLFLGVCAAETVVFGLLVTTVCCHQGYTTHQRRDSVGPEAVGNATTSAVVISCVLILVADYVLTSFLL